MDDNFNMFDSRNGISDASLSKGHLVYVSSLIQRNGLTYNQELGMTAPVELAAFAIFDNYNV